MTPKQRKYADQMQGAHPSVWYSHLINAVPVIGATLKEVLRANGYDWLAYSRYKTVQMEAMEE